MLEEFEGIRGTAKSNSPGNILSTWLSLAWALFKNGRVTEAKKFISEALRTGTKDARINYHAGIIYEALKFRDKAAEHFRLAMAVNSSFDPLQAESAKKRLSELTHQ